MWWGWVFQELRYIGDPWSVCAATSGIVPDRSFLTYSSVVNLSRLLPTAPDPRTLDG